MVMVADMVPSLKRLLAPLGLKDMRQAPGNPRGRRLPVARR